MDHSRQRPFTTTSFIFGLALATALVGWALYAYLFHEVSAIAHQTVALTSENAQLSDEQSMEVELKNDLAANQARQPVLNSYFVDATDPVPLFETIESYGQETNVTATIDSVDIKKSPNRLVVSVTGDGNFADVYRFVALLEAAPYEFSVSSASVRSIAAAPTNAPAPAAGKAAKAAAPTETQWETKLTLSILSVTGITSATTTSSN